MDLDRRRKRDDGSVPPVGHLSQKQNVEDNGGGKIAMIFGQQLANLINGRQASLSRTSARLGSIMHWHSIVAHGVMICAAVGQQSAWRHMYLTCSRPGWQLNGPWD
jgi:hypothetical protein